MHFPGHKIKKKTIFHLMAAIQFYEENTLYSSENLYIHQRNFSQLVLLKTLTKELQINNFNAYKQAFPTDIQENSNHHA
jgi:hypothetical protein